MYRTGVATLESGRGPAPAESSSPSWCSRHLVGKNVDRPPRSGGCPSPPRCARARSSAASSRRPCPSFQAEGAPEVAAHRPEPPGGAAVGVHARTKCTLERCHRQPSTRSIADLRPHGGRRRRGRRTPTRPRALSERRGTPGRSRLTRPRRGRGRAPRGDPSCEPHRRSRAPSSARGRPERTFTPGVEPEVGIGALERTLAEGRDLLVEALPWIRAGSVEADHALH